MKRSIRFDLISIVVTALGSMFLIVAGSTIWNAWSQRKLAEAEMARTVHAISAGLDDWLVATGAALEGLAAAFEQQGNVETLYSAAKAIKAKHPEWSEVILRNAAGEPIFTTTNALGEPLRAAGPRAHWAKKVIGEDSYQISDLMHSPTVNAYVAVVLRPAITKDGTRFGLSVSISADKWTRLLQQLRTPAGWVAGVVDNNGILIARTQSAAELVGQRAPEWFLDAIQAQPSGHVNGRSLEGEPLSVAYTRSDISGWTIALAAPEALMAAPLRRAMIVAVVVNGLVLGIGLLLVLIFARRLFQSLDWLARTADAMTEPGLSVSGAPSPMAGEVGAVHDAIRRASAHVRAANERQLTAMRELQHRVGNEIQAMISLVAMAGRAGHSEECRHVLRDLEGRMDVLHRAHAQLDRIGGADIVELGAFLRDICMHGIALYGSRTEGRIAFEAMTDEVLVPHAIAVSLGLITNEFVTNSSKHAFPKKPGTISLTLEASGTRQISLTLADDGVGIPPGNRRSSGLQLIAGLADQLGANVEWEVGAGTTLRLRLSGTFAGVQDAARRKEESQPDTRETLFD
ncbi:MAG TPA: sensor histidine kinase [Hyphomicrobiaceae bacterium]|nr:sensor histidine kinase [Hyphomicrobiaceae bacterium]